MPNKEAIRAWVEDLRSGKFRQGRNTLKTRSGAYCCLGVACETYRRVTGLEGAWKLLRGQGAEGKALHFVTGASAEDGVLPYEVATWLGLEPNPWLREGSGSQHVVGHFNDYRGWNFERIADAIERQYLS